MSNEKDVYDLVMAKIDGAQGVVRSKEATIRAMPLWGIEGGMELWVVQTIRVVGKGEYVFLDNVSAKGGSRLVLSPAVTAAIYRQRDSVSDKHRSSSARAVMAERMAQGYVPVPPSRRRAKKR